MYIDIDAVHMIFEPGELTVFTVTWKVSSIFRGAQGSLTLDKHT